MATMLADNVEGPSQQDQPAERRMILSDALRHIGRLLVLLTLDGFAVLLTLWIAKLSAGGAIVAALGFGIPFSMFFSIATIAFFCSAGLYRRSWRFLSSADCVLLASTVTGGLALAWAVCLLVFPQVRDAGAGLIAFAMLHGSLTLVMMVAMRITRRGLRQRSRARQVPARPAGERRRLLLLGELEWASAMIGLNRSDPSSAFEIVGVLTQDSRASGLWISGVPVLGSADMLPQIVGRLDAEGRRPETIVLSEAGDAVPRSRFKQIVSLADTLNITVARARDPWGLEGAPPANLEIEQLSLADLLGRPEVKLQCAYVDRAISGKRILVTGAGGTIGGELVRQLASFGPAEITLLDHSEYQLYSIEMAAREQFPGVTFYPELCSITQRSAVRQVFARRRPDLVFHAAALKHVPMVEASPCAGVNSNVLGTRNIADAVCEYQVRAMVQVSTDKAVNPVGLMGATKRLGELYCQALDLIGSCDPESPRFMTVRFGNVLGSSGSLVPLFQQQIAARKPLTVTHPDIERFFMTVQEAVHLILQSSGQAIETDATRGTIFVLDMGEPVKIIDIAKRMIRLAGLRPDVDIGIRFVGLRPGEKLYEELFDTSEDRVASAIPGVFEARPSPVRLEKLIRDFARLEALIEAGNDEDLRALVFEMIKAPASSRWTATLSQFMEDALRNKSARRANSAIPDIDVAGGYLPPIRSNDHNTPGWRAES